MKSHEIELLTDIRETAEDYDNALLASLSYEPRFFESRLLPALQGKDISDILLLLDAADYQQSFTKSAKYAGRMYFIEPITSDKTFHPKIYLLTSVNGAKLIIGSANLTSDAFTKDAEIVTVFGLHSWSRIGCISFSILRCQGILSRVNRQEISKKQETLRLDHKGFEL